MNKICHKTWRIMIKRLRNGQAFKDNTFHIKILTANELVKWRTEHFSCSHKCSALVTMLIVKLCFNSKQSGPTRRERYRKGKSRSFFAHILHDLKMRRGFLNIKYFFNTDKILFCKDETLTALSCLNLISVKFSFSLRVRVSSGCLSFLSQSKHHVSCRLQITCRCECEW